jgi:Leucine-rich repeat (LRR) protein
MKTAIYTIYRKNLHALLSLLLLLTSSGLNAQSRYAKALDFFQQCSPLKSASMQQEELQVRYQSQATANTTLTVFQSALQGYVIIAGDDKRHSIIGYSERGQFSYSQAPDALKELLKLYEASLDLGEPSPLKSGSITTPLSPLLDSKGISLNQYIHPETGGCSSGCVATAFAQIMAYHSYPQRGIGSHCYIHPNLGEICADFESTSYDWANMSDEAYQNLSLQLGIAMEMQYCLTSGMTGSAPALGNYESVMETHFGYQLYHGSKKSWYIHNELQQERPVYIAISGKNFAHAVVVDGIDSEGRFHVNFGWGGDFNGYYYLNTGEQINIGDRVFSSNVIHAVYLSPEAIEVNEQDSLALLAINDTFGKALPWDISLPVIKWQGVLVMNGRVIGLSLKGESNALEGYLPEELGLLSELRFLSVAGKLHATLPASLYQLTKLQELDLKAEYQSTLKASLSDDIALLENLESLSMEGFLEGSLPETLGQLSKLEYLHLYQNQLSGGLPASITNLSQLSNIYIVECGLEGSLPENIGQLSQLRSIGLSNNRISGSLPQSLGELSLLTSLNIDNNNFSGEIPASLGNCRELQALYLDNNALEGAVPPEIGQLSKLFSLTLHNNQLSSLPNELGRLTEITRLNVSHNNLSSLPDSLLQLKDLVELSANNNRISSLPNGFGNWRLLEVLDLSNNQIKDFPEELCFLQKLSELDLSYNKIEKLPVSIASFKLPRQMRLNNNEISDPIPLSFLQGDHWLLLADNRLTFEDIPQGDSYSQGFAAQKEVALSETLFKLPAGESISIDIRKLTGMQDPGNLYFWLPYPDNLDDQYCNAEIFTKEGPVLTLDIEEAQEPRKYYCKIFNNQAPLFDWEYMGNPQQTAVLPFLNTQALTVQAMTEDEEIEASYPENKVLGLEQIPNATITDRSVVLVSPFKVRGNIVWEASSDAEFWHELSANMSEPALAANIVSFNAQELVVNAQTDAWYRCVLREVNCDPLYGDPIKVLALGETLFDSMVNVDSEDFSIEVDSISVTLPKGLTEGDFRLQITKLKNPPAAPEGFLMGSVYDVSVDFGSEFTLPIEIRLKNLDLRGLDPKDLPCYKPVFFNEEKQEWEEYYAGGITLEDQDLYFRTFHLTKLGWWRLDHYSYTHSFENDKVQVIYRYNKSPQEDQYYDSYALDPKFSFNASYHNSNIDPEAGGAPYLVQDVAYSMKQIIEAFDAANLPNQLLMRKFTVYVGYTGHLLIDNLLGYGDAHGYINSSGYSQGYFFLNSAMAFDVDEVRRTLAHEYMHYIQSKWIKVEMGNYFFAEAHAPLADRLVWDAGLMKETEPELALKSALRPSDYSKTILDLLGDSWDAGTAPLFGIAEKFTVNSADANTSSAFLHYMRSYRDGEKLNIADLLINHRTSFDVITNWSWRTYLNSQIAGKLSSNIGKEYDDYLRYLLSGKNTNFTILSTEGGNIFSPLIINSGPSNDGGFVKRASWKYKPEESDTREENIEFKIPHLASRIVLLNNSTPDRSLVISYQPEHEANAEYKVYYAWYDHEIKEMQFEDISEVDKFSILLDARTEEAEKNFQNFALLIFVNRKCPDVIGLAANFNPKFKLKASPIINIDDLIYANVSDKFIHNYSDGSKGQFIITGRMDIARAIPLAYSWELKNYSRHKRMVNESIAVVEVSFEEYLNIDNGPTLPNTIQEWDKRQSIFYDILTGHTEIMQNTKTSYTRGEYYNAEDRLHPLHRYKLTDETHHIVLEDVLDFSTGIISDVVGKAHAFETNSTEHTQGILKTLEHSITETELAVDGQILGTTSKSLVGSDFSADGIIINLWFNCANFWDKWED